MKDEKQEKRLFKKSNSVSQKIADYEMAFDLIAELIADVKSEEEVIKRIINVFSTLFVFERLVFASIENNELKYYTSNQKLESISDEIKGVMSEFKGQFEKLEGNKSFLVRIEHNNVTYGVVYVNNIEFSERIDQYLNIALILSKISGLAISNARNYEKLNKLLKDLRLANDELVQFNYSVSHDLRQPLATISGYVNILQEIFKGKIEKSPESYIEEIIKASERMNEMIEGLLKYSKIGKEPNYEVIDLNDALSQAISNLQSLISSTGTQIENEKLPKVKANFIGMTILFQNLIDNAIKYCDKKKPKIKIDFKDKNGSCIISVSDNGIGVEKDKQGKIFELFYRIPGNKEQDGAGIGLSTCRKILKRHNGEIWVESSKNKGSTFYFAHPKI